MLSKKMIVSLALLVGVVLASVPALADTWSLAADYSSTAQGNRGWHYGAGSGLYFVTDASAFQTPVNYNAGGNRYLYFPVNYRATGGIAYALSDSMWVYDGGGSSIGADVAAGEVALMTNGNNQNSIVQWVAAVDGAYTYNVTFAQVGNSTNGVFVAQGDYTAQTYNQLGSENYFTGTASSQTYTYTGTVNLTAGQFLNFAVDALNQNGVNDFWNNTSLQTVQVDATIVSAPVPEPGSMMALATGLLGLVACSIRRRKS
jgi:hypothetical protein